MNGHTFLPIRVTEAEVNGTTFDAELVVRARGIQHELLVELPSAVDVRPSVSGALHITLHLDDPAEVIRLCERLELARVLTEKAEAEVEDDWRLHEE